MRCWGLNRAFFKTGVFQKYQPPRIGSCTSAKAVVKRIEGGSKMSGVDQLIVALWFLPVIIFIVLPLGVGFVWGVVSTLTSPFRRSVSLKDTLPAAELAA